jgi:hypothetical protein
MSECGHAAARQRRCARQRRVPGGRGVATERAWAAADVGRVCGLSEDDIGGWARVDGGRVRAAAGVRRAGGGRDAAGGRRPEHSGRLERRPGRGGQAEAGARRRRARGSWQRGSESSEKDRGRGA